MSVLGDIESAALSVPSDLSNLVAAVNPISQIFSDIKLAIDGLTAAVTSINAAIVAQQKQEFQNALAQFQQDISKATAPADYNQAAMDLHNTLSHL